MSFIKVDQTNIEKEHICCAISDKKGENCVASKKAWLKERFEDGLVFLKLNARGKVFIEYLPAEKAWCPIDAEGYFYINCFWVSGQYKGKGYANQLLDLCIKDVKEKGAVGLAILSSAKKMPFLSDPKYLKYKGFQIADTAEPYFQLLYLNFDGSDSRAPCFKPCVKKGQTQEPGLVLYYSNQCPHTEKYASVLQEIAIQRGTDFKLIKVDNVESAQSAPTMASYQAAGVSEGAFRTWIRLFQTRGSEGLLPARKKMKYSAELKVKVIKEYLQGGISFETLCTKYDITKPSIVQQWISGIIAMRSSDLQTAEEIKRRRD